STPPAISTDSTPTVNSAASRVESTLPGLVFRLVRSTLERARGTIPELPKHQVVYVRPNYASFDYREGGNISSTHSQVFEQRMESQPKALTDFFEQIIKVQTEYADCVRAISATYGIQPVQSEHYLNAFVT